MALQDWHAHAEHVDPLVPAGQPALSLLPPLTDLVVSAPSSRGTDLPDSEETAIGARIAEEIAVLTRVLMGLGAEPEPVVEAPAYVVPVVEPTLSLPSYEPLGELTAEEALAPAYDAPLFVAPPVVEVAPLFEVAPEQPVEVLVEAEPVSHEERAAILDELAFLDT